MSASITNKLIESTAYLVTGSILAAVSTAALVMLLDSLPMSSAEQIIAIAAGIGLQCSLYLLAKKRDIAARFVVVVLLCVSVVASVAFFESSWNKHANKIKHAQIEAAALSLSNNRLSFEKSERAAQIRRKIDTLNNIIAIKFDVATKDTAGNYTTRGLNQLKEIEPLTVQIDTLSKELHALATSTSYNTVIQQSETGSLQALLADASRPVRFLVFAVLGALIDICALLCLCRCRSSDSRQLATVKTANDMADNRLHAVAATGNAELHAVETSDDSDDFRLQPIDSTVATDTTDHCYISIMQEKILSGGFGERPSKRKAIEEIEKAFALLAESGRIAKKGNIYRVIG